MDSEQAAIGIMDGGRADENIRDIYSMTRNPTTEDFGTMLGR
jgi:hypothetical protein